MVCRNTVATYFGRSIARLNCCWPSPAQPNTSQYGTLFT
jgi:hypothetical protein